MDSPYDRSIYRQSSLPGDNHVSAHSPDSDFPGLPGPAVLCDGGSAAFRAELKLSTKTVDNFGHRCGIPLIGEGKLALLVSTTGPGIGTETVDAVS